MFIHLYHIFQDNLIVILYPQVSLSTAFSWYVYSCSKVLRFIPLGGNLQCREYSFGNSISPCYIYMITKINKKKCVSSEVLI